jgi:hypothetical protein
MLFKYIYNTCIYKLSYILTYFYICLTLLYIVWFVLEFFFFFL